MVCADPEDYKKNDEVCACLTKSLSMSGLSVSGMDKCDSRNLNAVDALDTVDVLILPGGHVPTQNRFLQLLRLKERLRQYRGIVVAWSAGSMNCAGTVYAPPEFKGEAMNPSYQRWLSGLGLTDIHILPHFQRLEGDYLDGLRVIEDITYGDSVEHEILALNDGSYLLLEAGKATLYGEAYLIKDRQLRKVCSDGECIPL